MTDRKLIVAMLGPFPPANGGIVTNIQNLLKSPLRENYTFLNFRTMSANYGTPNYQDEKIFIKTYRVFSDLIHFIYFLIKESPRIIHINTSFGAWAFWRDSAYLLLSKIFFKKTVFQIHGGELNEFEQHKSPLTKFLIRKILNLPDSIIVLSSAQRKPFLESKLAEKVKVFPNTVDLQNFKKNGNLRAEFNLPSHSKIILFIAAHFYKEKGGMDLLKSIPLVIKKHSNVMFVLVGGGGEEVKMKKYCQNMNMQKYVTFTGYLSPEEITRLQLSSDIFAFPTYYSEGLPLVILESMAAGLPVISTPVRAIPEVIENEKNGYLIQPKDPVKLSEKITYLIENKNLRKKMGRNNIQKIKEKYDINVVAKIFNENYQKILKDNVINSV
jgi:glycosyltransferase involved in cell wall biosynthesis